MAQILFVLFFSSSILFAENMSVDEISKLFEAQAQANKKRPHRHYQLILLQKLNQKLILVQVKWTKLFKPYRRKRRKPLKI